VINQWIIEFITDARLLSRCPASKLRTRTASDGV